MMNYPQTTDGTFPPKDNKKAPSKESAHVFTKRSSENIHVQQYGNEHEHNNKNLCELLKLAFY